MINHDIQYEGLTHGQVVKTMGRQVAIPYKYSYKEYDFMAEREVQGKVCIKLAQVGAEAPEWYINTGSRQTGLVCYLDTEYEGCAILSVRIRMFATRSVYADPVEYITVPLIMPMVDIGTDAQLVFGLYKDDTKTVWHNKTE